MKCLLVQDAHELRSFTCSSLGAAAAAAASGEEFKLLPELS